MYLFFNINRHYTQQIVLQHRAHQTPKKGSISAHALQLAQTQKHNSS